MSVCRSATHSAPDLVGSLATKVDAWYLATRLENIHLTQSSFKEETDIATAGLETRNSLNWAEHRFDGLFTEKHQDRRAAESLRGPNQHSHGLIGRCQPHACCPP
jgi:hypothetical protein